MDGQAFARVGPRLSAVPSLYNGSVSSFVDARGEARCQPNMSAGFQYGNKPALSGLIPCLLSGPTQQLELAFDKAVVPHSQPSLATVICAATEPHSPGTPSGHLVTVRSSLHTRVQ